MPFDASMLLRELFREPLQAAPPASASMSERRGNNAPGWPVNHRKQAIKHLHNSDFSGPRENATQFVPLPRPCSWCRSSVFWKSIGGTYVCSNCHPPAYPALAEMWGQLVATDDGPQLVRLTIAPHSG
jgi:hypothetical protein